MDDISDWIKRRLRLAVARADIRVRAQQVSERQGEPEPFIDLGISEANRIMNKAIDGALEQELEDIIRQLPSQNKNR